MNALNISKPFNFGNIINMPLKHFRWQMMQEQFMDENQSAVVVWNY